ncbi:aspartate/glutamate racemase family protein [Dyella sp.]|uniref:aspartate/glutamate racemase family protein n=1 Tax=Dyella sp. TaxID=1869338 RepID=UPI002B4A6A15|nr:aspartate/glutamate racemase family protein [Dyella sp.]HKT28507.1 aspartate/glutamate racemase family protein [Dyella sp.]
MKTLGLIGGMSWESTAHYYSRINQLVAERLGGLHSAQLLLYSVEFDELQRLQHADDWTGAAHLLIDAARRLERAGAEALVICANTMHIVAPEIEAAVKLPLIHVVDATAKAVKDRGIRSVALLGTRFTMEKDFYRLRLEQRHSLRVMIPEEPERAAIHRIIFEELCKGVVRPESRRAFFGIISRLAKAGAQGAILGCTEFTLFGASSDAGIPLFDTTEIHTRAVVDWALSA